MVFALNCIIVFFELFLRELSVVVVDSHNAHKILFRFMRCHLYEMFWCMLSLSLRFFFDRWVYFLFFILHSSFALFSRLPLCWHSLISNRISATMLLARTNFHWIEIKSCLYNGNDALYSGLVILLAALTFFSFTETQKTTTKQQHA